MRRAVVPRQHDPVTRSPENSSGERYSVRSRIVLVCIGAFVIGIALSMLAYPGGTWWAPTRQGHAFLENFLCDLLHDPALNRKTNGFGASMAKVAMLALIVGIGVFWSMSARWLRSQRIARLVSKLGVFGTLPLAMVPITPSNRYPTLHTVAVLLGGLPALTAFVLFSAAFLREQRGPVTQRLFTAALCLLTITCLCLYAQGALGYSASPRSLPALERGAVLLLLVWLLGMLRRRPNCW